LVVVEGGGRGGEEERKGLAKNKQWKERTA